MYEAAGLLGNAARMACAHQHAGVTLHPMRLLQRQYFHGQSVFSQWTAPDQPKVQKREIAHLGDTAVVVLLYPHQLDLMQELQHLANNWPKRLFFAETEVKYLRDEKQQQSFAEVPKDTHHCKHHPGKVAIGVPNKDLGGKPVVLQQRKRHSNEWEQQIEHIVQRNQESNHNGLAHFNAVDAG
ncbi:hypothetical protein KC338_g221 [Hortaea werneckii]|nr:hypothetical protein KC338_g221 [Hortaea werneckii]